MTRRVHLTLLMISVGLIVVVISCNKGAGLSPTAAYKAYLDALRNKDIPTYKKRVSRNYLKEEEELAKRNNQSLDDYLKTSLENTSKIRDEVHFPDPKTRNEKIDGAKATIEIQVPEGEYVTRYLVKEEDEWKVATEQEGETNLSQNVPRESFIGAWTTSAGYLGHVLAVFDGGGFMFADVLSRTGCTGNWTVSGNTLLLECKEVFNLKSKKDADVKFKAILSNDHLTVYDFDATGKKEIFIKDKNQDKGAVIVTPSPSHNLNMR